MHTGFDQTASYYNQRKKKEVQWKRVRPFDSFAFAEKRYVIWPGVKCVSCEMSVIPFRLLWAADEKKDNVGKVGWSRVKDVAG